MDNQMYTREEHNAYAQRVAMEYLHRNEHNEYVKRMEDEHERQNARIKELEDDVKQYGEITIAVNRLADNVDHLCKKQDSFGKRLDGLEARDGDMWRKVSSHVITTVVGAVVAFLLLKLGI